MVGAVVLAVILLPVGIVTIGEVLTIVSVAPRLLAIIAVIAAIRVSTRSLLPIMYGIWIEGILLTVICTSLVPMVFHNTAGGSVVLQIRVSRI